MQLARDYQMYTSSSPEERVADDHPMFLVVMIGMHRPLLFPFLPDILRRYPFLHPLGIPGTVVEPLARPCTMALDSTGECESELAQLLYSLRKTITRLRLYVFVNQWLAFPLTECLLERTDNPATTVQQYPESTPRIYDSFETTRMPRRSWSLSRSSRPIMKGQCNSW